VLDIHSKSSYLDIMRNRVREHRSRVGLTQADLATALGVSRQTVISIETGRYLPSLPLAFGIANLFEVPLEHLFEPNGEEPHA
jgi:putative transcriptional regulator